MTSSQPQTAAPAMRVRWFQFTLRELLLVGLALCLLMALIVSQRRSTATSFYRSFPANANKAVADVCSRLGLAQSRGTLPSGFDVGATSSFNEQPERGVLVASASIPVSLAAGQRVGKSCCGVAERDRAAS